MNSLYYHEHGGQSERLSGRIPAGELIDFSVSISPFFPLRDPLQVARADLQAYPSIEGKGVQGFYARRFGLDESSVIALNGAIEGIYLLPRALGVRRMLLLEPSFYEYGRAARIAGAETGFVGLSAVNGFSLPPVGELAARLEHCDAFFAANPNNPTGTLFPPEVTMALASRFPDKWFFVDEAFIQFLPDFPAVSLMQHTRAFRNIVVVHSLTKFYALPGLRLGAIIAHPDTIGRLYDFKEPWTLNAVAERVAGELADCLVYEAALRSMIAGERERLAAALPEIDGVRVAGGAANFLLAQWRRSSPLDELLSHFLSRGILVRDCRNFHGLEAGYFRFAVRTPQENDRFLEALRAVPAPERVS
ncbi:threonine-phosphate decarboxylase CobD [Chlorobium sp.]|uniref:threonine-phosphate decarboxylase CobD n=1 Tax=Chlorobium sp. TaxID=1095 RepID=UPI003C379DDB